MCVLTLAKQLSALHPELQAEGGVDQNVCGRVDGEQEVAEHNSVEEPQWHMLLARRLAVIPAADVGGLVEVEDQPRQVADKEDNDEAQEDHGQPVLGQVADVPPPVNEIIVCIFDICLQTPRLLVSFEFIQTNVSQM